LSSGLEVLVVGASCVQPRRLNGRGRLAIFLGVTSGFAFRTVETARTNGKRVALVSGAIEPRLYVDVFSGADDTDEGN
jgi:hypothetical protein